MDTSEQTRLETIKPTKRRRRSLEEKRRIVEETWSLAHQWHE